MKVLIRKILLRFNMYGFVGYVRRRLDQPTSVGWGRQKYTCSDIGKHMPLEFSCLKILGAGKDSIASLAVHNHSKVVFKLLSPYGKRFLNRMRKFSTISSVASDHLYQIEVYDEFYIYKYENLNSAPLDPAGVLDVVSQICTLQTNLIEHGFIYWDFGSAEQNYMFTDSGVLKIIDYGGNAYIGLNDSVNTYRKLLSSPNSDFIRCQLFLHLVIFGLGDVRAREFMSSAQFSIKGVMFALSWIEDRVDGTFLEEVFLNSDSIDFLTTGGWKNFKSSIAHIQNKGIGASLESADIDSVDLLDECVVVKGYQSYKICREGFEMYKTNNLWNTEIKSSKVVDAIQYALKEKEIHSMQDVGCNLGLYVFLCSKELGIESCYGYDYNEKYINACNQIKLHLDVAGASFLHSGFSNLTKKSDLFLCLGLIHHLFHRTEQWGDLDLIVKHIRGLTKQVLIIEFPTDSDPKAEKWVNLPGRKKISDYSVEAFEESLSSHFSSYEVVNKIANTRILYVAFC